MDIFHCVLFDSLHTAFVSVEIFITLEIVKEPNRNLHWKCEICQIFLRLFTIMGKKGSMPEWLRKRLHTSRLLLFAVRSRYTAFTINIYNYFIDSVMKCSGFRCNYVARVQYCCVVVVAVILRKWISIWLSRLMWFSIDLCDRICQKEFFFNEIDITMALQNRRNSQNVGISSFETDKIATTKENSTIFWLSKFSETNTFRSLRIFFPPPLLSIS